MENSKLIETLKEALFNNKWCIITDLISDLQQEVLKADVKGVTPKSRIAKTMSYHKKMLKRNKPILAFTSDDSMQGYQVFTDSYFLVALKGDDLLTIPDYKKGNELYKNDSKLNPNGRDFSGIYPDVSRLFPNDFRGTFKSSAGELIKACKAYKIIHFKNYDVDTYVASELLERYMLFMNYNTNDIIEFNISSGFKPLVSYHNESKGLLLPVRCDDENDVTIYQAVEVKR